MDDLSLSICVVTFESETVVERFMNELLASLAGHRNYEVLVYDNSISDNIIDLFEKNGWSDHTSVTFTSDKSNQGFSYANNQLILRAKYEKVLLLNPDVFSLTHDVWHNVLTKYQPGTTMFVRLLNPDESFQDCIGEPPSLKRIFSNKDFSAISERCEIENGIMAFMLTDKNIFAKVGLLDCSYPLYCEDIDWCYRTRLFGFQIIYEPSIELIHLGGASAATKWKQNQILRKKYAAERIFINKYFSGLNKLLMLTLNCIKVLLKTYR